MTSPRRGDIWQANLEPVVGHEQGGERPVLILSEDAYNRGGAGLAIIVPITRRRKYAVPAHVEVAADEGTGLSATSHILCDAIRSVSTDRLIRRRGGLPGHVLVRVGRAVRMLLGL